MKDQKIRLKKSCDGCRAFAGGSCSLQHTINIDYSGFYKKYSPAEWCEKPKTYSEFMFLRSILK